MAQQNARINCAAFRSGAVIVAMVLFALGALGQDLVVDCTGQNQNAYHSINEALPNMPFVSYQVVMQVTGTCNESVYLGHVRNLMIAAPLGQRATIQGDGVTFAVLNVDSSTGIYLYGLNIRGSGSEGMSVASGSEVRIDTCTFQDNLGDGIGVSDNSAVTIYSASFTGNNRGISISSNAIVDHASWALGSVTMSSNANSGIWMSGGRFSTGGNMTIQNNGFAVTGAYDGFGAVVHGAGQIQFGNYAGPNLITGNRRGGVYYDENGEVSFWGGTNTVTNNGPVGIQGRYGSQLTLFGNVEISGHTAIGLDVGSRSQAYLDSTFGSNLIHNNGTGTTPVRAGIRVDGNSQITLIGPNQIMQNGGPGVLGDINSSMDISGATISSNQAEGIRLLHQTVLDLGSGMVFGGNTGGSVTCDNTSLLVTSDKIQTNCASSQATEFSLPEMTQSAPVVPNFSGKMEEYKRFRALIPHPQR
jgi:hypothetical protein